MELSHLTTQLERLMIELPEALGFFHTQKKPIYCQYCGEDVTSKGAKVSELGIVYCQKNSCVRLHVIEEGLNCSNFFTARQLQKAIKNGTLTHYKRPDLEN